ncbi:hypothetical protein QQF64_015728 [Cirrhinus molitorella]|uniref:Transmembrane protein n=1 Tax=Cirrhinus molitorella TaxID=172907 RepID=A0ABR3NVT9_9TELE
MLFQRVLARAFSFARVHVYVCERERERQNTHWRCLESLCAVPVSVSVYLLLTLLFGFSAHPADTLGERRASAALEQKRSVG